MSARPSIWRDLLTGADGRTHDIGRWGAVLMCLTGMGLQIFDVVHQHHAFDIQAFGIGCGSLAAGIGAMLRLKETTDPKP